MSWGESSPFSIDFGRGPYHSAALLWYLMIQPSNLPNSTHCVNKWVKERTNRVWCVHQHTLCHSILERRVLCSHHLHSLWLSLNRFSLQWTGVLTRYYADQWLAKWRSALQTASLFMHSVSTAAVALYATNGRYTDVVSMEPGYQLMTARITRQVCHFSV